MGRFPRVTHPSATLTSPERPDPVRLACVRHAASVRSEPGSNSQVNLERPQQKPRPQARPQNRRPARKQRPAKVPRSTRIPCTNASLKAQASVPARTTVPPETRPKPPLPQPIAQIPGLRPRHKPCPEPSTTPNNRRKSPKKITRPAKPGPKPDPPPAYPFPNRSNVQIAEAKPTPPILAPTRSDRVRIILSRDHDASAQEALVSFGPPAAALPDPGGRPALFGEALVAPSPRYVKRKKLFSSPARRKPDGALPLVGG